MTRFQFGGDIVWRPTPELIAQSNLSRFMARHGLAAYGDLLHRSVIRQPWIGMTRGFWRDPQRYQDTYSSRFPDTWVHGDWAAIDADGLWYILGRSDDTIKIAGKRVGPAEVESTLVGHPAVSEAAAVGVPDEIKGESLVCFCVLQARTRS